MRRLYQLSTSSVKAVLHVVPGGTHNDTWVRGGVKYWEAFRHFIDAVSGAGGEGGGGFGQGVGGAQANGGSVAMGIPIMPGSLAGIAKEGLKKEL